MAAIIPSREEGIKTKAQRKSVSLIPLAPDGGRHSTGDALTGYIFGHHRAFPYRDPSQPFVGDPLGGFVLIPLSLWISPYKA